MSFLKRILLTGFLTAISAITVSTFAYADVTPSPVFGNHMVLQRDTDYTVWGLAGSGEKVTVTIDGAKSEATADAEGKWSAALPAHKAGTGFNLTIEGKNKIELTNLAFGDVWICSGQSNMEWSLRQLPKDDQGKKVAAQAANPNIRLLTIPKTPSLKPETTFKVSDYTGRWHECNEKSAYDFSAVGYFFGREIQKAQNVPVGLIASNWGGTVCEAWASREALNAVPEFKYFHENLDKSLASYDETKAEENYQKAMEKWKTDAEKAKAEGKAEPRKPTKQAKPDKNPNAPSNLFNGMIHPLLNLKIKGAIWYQGESNSGRAQEYYSLFPTMIEDWRKQFKQEVPFFCVQLAPYRADDSDKVSYAELRDAQYQTMKKLKNCGIAIITDAGNETDIHPQQKEPAGVRLALAARAVVYGEKIDYQGPTFKSFTDKGEGKISVTFDNLAGGLQVKGDTLTGFQICGEDKKFVAAKAEVQGGDTVVVSAEGITKPVAVRYGWVNFAKPTLNLFNKAGLPAVPFRSDDFPLTTQFPGKK